MDVEFLPELIEQLHTLAVIEPGILLARIQPEGDGGIKTKGRILADEIIAGGVAHLDLVVADRIQRRQRRHDLAGREYLDLEFVVARFGDIFRQRFRRAVKRLKRFWK